MIFHHSAKLLFAIASVTSMLAFNNTALAAPLQVSPVSVDLTAPGQTSTVNLRNEGDRPVNVQVRVFSWTQVNGEDKLTPSRDVVASPPAATLQPGTTYTIRIARIAPPLKAGEETYRLLIDQLPEVNIRRPSSAVDLAIRYSIPIFFAERAAGAELQWNVSRSGKTLIAEATNVGNRHANRRSRGRLQGRYGFLRRRAEWLCPARLDPALDRQCGCAAHPAWRQRQCYGQGG